MPNSAFAQMTSAWSQPLPCPCRISFRASSAFQIDFNALIPLSSIHGKVRRDAGVSRYHALDLDRSILG